MQTLKAVWHGPHPEGTSYPQHESPRAVGEGIMKDLKSLIQKAWTSYSTTMVILAAGCGENPADTGVIFRDSTGIAIVENSAPVWTEENSWRLAESPAVIIGLVEGDPAYELFQVVGAARLTDGRIVVANSGTHELRFFDSFGKHNMNAGREGGGPGESQRLSMIQRIDGDSLVTYDVRWQRVSIFDSEGSHIRDVNIGGPGRQYVPTVVGRFSDGSYLGRCIDPVTGPDVPELTPGGLREGIHALRVGPDGETFDTVGAFPARILQVVERTNRPPVPYPIWHTPETHLAVDGDGMIIGTSDAYEVRKYGMDSSLTQIVRKEHVPLPVTQSDVDSFVNRELEGMGVENISAELQHIIDRIPTAETLPAYSSFVTDIGGSLWVEEYRRIGDYSPQWSLFSPEGRWLGLVTGPVHFRATDIGADYVLGITTDELGLERVTMYQLIKP
jgi:hypothetical protein